MVSIIFILTRISVFHKYLFFGPAQAKWRTFLVLFCRLIRIEQKHFRLWFSINEIKSIFSFWVLSEAVESIAVCQFTLSRSSNRHYRPLFNCSVDILCFGFWSKGMDATDEPMTSASGESIKVILIDYSCASICKTTKPFNTNIASAVTRTFLFSKR